MFIGTIHGITSCKHRVLTRGVLKNDQCYCWSTSWSYPALETTERKPPTHPKGSHRGHVIFSIVDNKRFCCFCSGSFLLKVFFNGGFAFSFSCVRMKRFLLISRMISWWIGNQKQVYGQGIEDRSDSIIMSKWEIYIKFGGNCNWEFLEMHYSVTGLKELMKSVDSA